MAIDSKRDIFWNTASQVVARVLTLAISLVSIKLLTNYLGVVGLGHYNTINTYAGIIIVVADLGLFTVAVREITQKPDQEKKILSNVLTVRIVSALMASLVAAGLVYLTGYEAAVKTGVLIASTFILFNLIGSVYDIFLQAHLKMQYSALSELISRVISITALALVVFYHGSFYLVVATISLYGLATFVLKYFFVCRFLRFGAAHDRALTMKILNMAWPLGLVFIVNNIFFKLDTLMLFAIKGAGAVGIYSVAYRVLEGTTCVGAFFANSLLPVISHNIKDNKERVARVINKSLPIMFFVALPIVLLCVVLSRDIILFLSNDDFVLGSRALVILAFTLPFIYWDILLGSVLVANDERRFMIRMALSILAFNFLTNLFMIDRYSFIGAAITTLVSEILLVVINACYIRRRVGCDIKVAGFMKMLAIAVVAGLIGFMLKIWIANFVVVGVLMVAFYVALGWLGGIANAEFLRGIVGRDEAIS